MFKIQIISIHLTEMKNDKSRAKKGNVTNRS